MKKSNLSDSVEIHEFKEELKGVVVSFEELIKASSHSVSRPQNLQLKIH